jgi:hypothetical protein
MNNTSEFGNEYFSSWVGDTQVLKVQMENEFVLQITPPLARR